MCKWVYIMSMCHHGGKLTNKDRIYCYDGGKVKIIYDQSLDTISLNVCYNFVKFDLGQNDFKIYQHKEGTSLDSCQLSWNENIVRDMCTYALKTGTCSIYIDHTSDNMNDCYVGD